MHDLNINYSLGLVVQLSILDLSDDYWKIKNGLDAKKETKINIEV